MTDRSLAVAVGGNALIRDGQRGTIAEQTANARETARPIAALVAAGWKVVVTHPRELAEGHHRDISAYGDWRVYTAARGGHESAAR